MTADVPMHLVPELRFPEFQDSGEWETRKFGDVISRSKETFDPHKSHVTPHLIELECIESKTGRILRVAELEKQNSLKSRFQAGDVLFGKLRPYLRKFARPDFQGVCTSEIWVLQSKEISSAFLFYLIQTERFIQLANISSGSRMPRAEWNFLAGADFKFPNPDEQRKIADCLGSLDDLIAAEDRKLEALRQHKKGLMQQLFPQPGETVPLLGGQSDWKTFDLSKVAYFQEGPGIMAADFHSAGVPLVRLSGLAEETVTLDGCNFLDSHKVTQKWTHFRLAVGDLVISTSASFGRVSTVTETAAGAVFYTGLVRFRSTDERLSNAYLKAYLESPDFLRQVESHAVGGGIKHFGPTHLRQMQIQVPPLFDQLHIAEVLSSLDVGVDGQCRKLDTLRRHKHGLLQQLFPSLEANRA